MLALRVFLVAFLFPLVTFVFGWSVLARFTRLDREERFAASWGVGVFVMAASEFLAFLLDQDQTKFNACVVIEMLLVAAFCLWDLRRRGGLPPDTTSEKDEGTRPGWPLPGLWVLGYLSFLAIQALLPIYAGAYWMGDWCMHYHTAQIFREHVPVHADWADYTLASRTPVFNLTAAFVQSLVGDEFWVYEIAATLLNYCFVAPLYLVLRDLAGRRAARLALVLVPLNLWIMHVAWFTWSKMLAAYFILLGLHCYLQFVQRRQAEPSAAWRYFIGFWASSWIGFMTHQVGLLYVVALSFHALILARRDRKAVWLGDEKVLTLGAVLVAIVGPWYSWLRGEFGIAEIKGRTPVTRMDTSQTFTAVGIAYYMGYVLVGSVVPFLLIRVLYEGSPEDGRSLWPLVYDALTDFYFSLLTGALTVSLLLFLAASLFKRRREPRPPADPCAAECRGAVWLFLLFGILGGAFLHPAKMDHGIAHAALFPSVLVIVGLAWAFLLRSGGVWTPVVMTGMIGEFLGMFWSHIWYVVKDPHILDPWDINLWEKGNQHVVFLNDLDFLGPHPPAVLVLTLALQVIFTVLALAWTRPAPLLLDKEGPFKSERREVDPRTEIEAAPPTS